MQELFFNPEFTMDFDWRDRFHLRVGSVRPHNKKQISEGLRNMSPESIRNRFLGSKREFSDQELQYLTNLDGWNHYALGMEERDGNKRGIAIVRLVRASHDFKEAEVAITIIDDFQKRGLGSLLLNLIILAAKEREIERLSFTFLPLNYGIIHLINKVGVPFPGPQNQDYTQLFLDVTKFETEELKSRVAGVLPDISNFNFR